MPVDGTLEDRRDRLLTTIEVTSLVVRWPSSREIYYTPEPNPNLPFRLPIRIGGSVT